MDVWKIGVAISLTNGMSPVLAVIAKDLLGIKGQVGDVEQAFSSWKPALAGAAAILAGGLMLDGMSKLADHGADVNHQLELMKTAGMQNSEIQSALAQAMKTSGDVQTTVLSENLAHIRELRYAFGETATAMKDLDLISKSNAVLNAVKGGGVDQVWELVKALEGKGLTYDPGQFASYVDTMTKVVEATGGKVTPQSFMSAFKYGRTATLGWDEGFVGGALPRLIQSMSSGSGSGGGSGGPGNALMSAFAKVVQGQMSKTAAEEFANMGLAPGGISHIKGSAQTQITGGIAGHDLFMANPYEWTQQVLMPALAKHGITSQNDIIAQISKMFPVRTASQVITEMGLQGRFAEGERSPFEKDIRLQGGAMGLNKSYDELSNNDYATVTKEFHAQLKSLLEVLGGPLMQMAIPAMKALTDVATGMGQWAAVHPEMVKAIGQALVGLGIGLVAIGGVAIASVLGLSGALIGLGVAAISFLAFNWTAITGWVKNVVAAMGELASMAWQKIVDVLQGVYNAIYNFINNLATLPGIIGRALGGLPSGQSPGAEVGGMVGHLHKSSYVPPSGGSAQPVVVHTAFNVDGRTLAKTVGQYMAKNSSWSNNSSTFDGSAMPPATDMSFA